MAGPVVDLVYTERLGRRRAWIVGCQLLMVATLLVAWPIDFVTKLSLFTWIIFIHNVFAAIQDVAIDALAVGTLPKEERGVVNGLMFAGAYLGQAIGGAGVLFLSAWIGFGATFPFVCAAILAVTLGVAIWLREPRRAPIAEAATPVSSFLKQIQTYVAQAFYAVLGSRRGVAGLAFALLPAGAYSLSLTLQTNVAVEFGMSDDRIGLLAMFSTILAAGGCLLGGWLSDRFGRRKTIAAYVVLTAFPTLVFAWYMQRHGWIMPIDTTAATRPATPGALLAAFWTACILYSFFQGLTYGARTALFMDLCNPAVAATQFTAYMALMNLVISYSAWWQGYVIERAGYPWTLTLDALFGLVCIAALPFMTPGPRDRTDSVAPEFPKQVEPTGAFEVR